ncbi:plasmid maintenance system killer protein [Mesorhizobium australicum WSM2073]|uniref:Plasmid maintenance system killer protein n=3 Tax=Mesorhizobium TaxID=68287 RepID=L0KSR3_MESAW|nr:MULTISPECIES: type II toxin-antitoxin system RelE/ParE family toxin [Mesorhizobium]ADV14899.1 plasmid maintenance system killer [Mesorhizobium ciceri biovar biserrulae WSM1271]AEH90786.1 plasmid maintenance system killer [Mesorhizobium opportunistum WSM2075]AGB48156.1 plasmid maintenance system killer protein [Mesorhizobium australicum WSM2073]OBP84742.1 plasmid maintenance system killer protein [Mesorhizobium loti]
MEIEFADDDLDKLDHDPSFDAGFGPDIVRGFCKALWALRAAVDQRDLYRGGLRFEKLQGRRGHQHSVRLTKQWRLIIEIVTDNEGTRLRVIEITDYH